MNCDDESLGQRQTCGISSMEYHNPSQTLWGLPKTSVTTSLLKKVTYPFKVLLDRGVYRSCHSPSHSFLEEPQIYAAYLGSWRSPWHLYFCYTLALEFSSHLDVGYLTRGAYLRKPIMIAAILPAHKGTEGSVPSFPDTFKEMARFIFSIESYILVAAIHLCICFTSPRPGVYARKFHGVMSLVAGRPGLLFRNRKQKIPRQYGERKLH
ncbi:hypothetical protein F4778DRAFT_419839 [Xylariomycetidae sp. FL2044]|nr:hypothetical protein F4778DRAFT_419839 [Xylariomycetidae sp. FL2044]